MLTYVYRSGFGFWDAWAIWNLKARFLACGTPAWRRVFSEEIDWSHTDYPLLLPLNVARLWTYQGDNSTLISAALSIVFSLLVVGTLYAGVSRLRGSVQGCLAVLALVATTGFTQQGAYQAADIPLGFFLLASLCALTLSYPDRRLHPRTLVLSGLLIGGAVWTKNEGSLLACVLLASVLPVALREGGPKLVARYGGLLLLGLALPLACLATMKLGFAGESDLFRGRTWSDLLEKVTDGSRHSMILQVVGKQVWYNIGGWLSIALLALAVVSGLRIEAPLRPASAWIALTLVGITVSFYVVYLLTPRELPWHLATSSDRLVMQIWPSILFGYFIFVRPPIAPGRQS